MADMAAYMRARRARRRERLLALAGDRCCLCGSQEDLQFDHRDPRSRRFRLTGPGLDRSWAEIIEELQRCDLLCASCHRAKTKAAGEHGGGRNRRPRLCGTPKGYNLGCRCQPCRRAKALYRRGLIAYGQVAA